MPVDIDGALGFRWDHYPYRLIVEEGAAPDLAAVSYEVGDETAFARIVEALTKAGIEVRIGSSTARPRRGGSPTS